MALVENENRLRQAVRQIGKAARPESSRQDVRIKSPGTPCKTCCPARRWGLCPMSVLRRLRQSEERAGRPRIPHRRENTVSEGTGHWPPGAGTYLGGIPTLREAASSGALPTSAGTLAGLGGRNRAGSTPLEGWQPRTSKAAAASTELTKDWARGSSQPQVASTRRARALALNSTGRLTELKENGPTEEQDSGPQQ